MSYARQRGVKTELPIQDLPPAALAQGYAVGYCSLWSKAVHLADAVTAQPATTSMPTSTRLQASPGAKV